MTLHEALNRLNFYLTIFLILSIASIYAGEILNVEFIKMHFIFMVIVEIIFLLISSIILYKIIEWCYKKKKPKWIFDKLERQNIKKCRDRFNKLYDLGGDKELIKGYIDNSINEIKANKDNKIKIGLALDQLLQWINEDFDIQAYLLNKLTECIKYNSDEKIAHAIVSVICIYNKKIKENI